MTPQPQDKPLEGEYAEKVDASETSALALVEEPAALGIIRDPDIVLAEAKKAANALTQVINSKPKKVILNGEQYLEAED